MTQNTFKKLYEPKLHPMFESIPDDMALSPDVIAEMLNLSAESIRRWCRTGQLPNYNFGNKFIIMGSDFKEHLKKHKTKKQFEKALVNE